LSIAYVLIAGVINNGFSIRGVFSDIALARAAAVTVPKSSHKSSWKEVARNRWHCADEYVTIEEYEINVNIHEERPSEFDDAMNDYKPKYFVDSFDSQPEIMIDSLSDMDLVGIWQAQVETGLKEGTLRLR